jgi:stearoyl-CoA desaturase (delta-9 desaturase)
MSDLNRDPVVDWQIKLIGYGYVFLGLIMPAAIGHYYGDMIGGIAWIGIMARILSWNGIWATNSLAHWYGDRPYNDDTSTARGSLIAAIICNGEGNHNYHHEFPKDYRHGVKWYEWDPTKWCIWVWALMGQAYQLHRCHPHSIKHAELKVKENTAHRLLTELRRQRMALASWYANLHRSQSILSKHVDVSLIHLIIIS